MERFTDCLHLVLQTISDSYRICTLKLINQSAQWPCMIGEYKQCWLQSGCSGSRPRDRGAARRSRPLHALRQVVAIGNLAPKIRDLHFIRQNAAGVFIATIFLGTKPFHS